MTYGRRPNPRCQPEKIITVSSRPDFFRKEPFGQNIEGFFAWNQAVLPVPSEFNRWRLW